MQITFLGTNGWFDTKIGNTICTLIETKDKYIILDAGLGIHKLKKYYKKDKPVYLFISHLHLDHIYGMHLLPLFDFKQPLTILLAQESMQKFKFIINHPFTGALKNLKYKAKIIGLKQGSYKKPLKFDCRLLKHADLTLGYRLYLENKIISYCSDTGPCDNAIALGKNADILVHECAFLPGESDVWGHANPKEAAAIAKKAGAKRLFLTHFGADRYDSIASRKKAERIAKQIFPNSRAAFDDLTITL
ncbi:MAG: ribonuclease Z [Patescibacteria group bacterium]